MLPILVRAQKNLKHKEGSSVESPIIQELSLNKLGMAVVRLGGCAREDALVFVLRNDASCWVQVDVHM